MTVTEQLSALDLILAQGTLNTLFQPILSLSEQRIHGYEALSRGPSNSPLHAPMPLFGAARHAGRLGELEALCRKNACRRFRELDLGGRLFLNVSPEVLLEPERRTGHTLELLNELGIPPHKVVIELTEQTPIKDFALLDAALYYYRAMGFSIALDDLGAGYASLRLWSELRPDYVKIDRHFIDGIDRDPLKREFVDSILRMARASRARIIAEGIERPEELATLVEMGVDLLQGYLFARPTERPASEPCQCLPHPRPAGALPAEDDASLAALLIEQPGVADGTPVAEVLELFRRQASLNTLAVLDAERRPIGVVQRHALSNVMLKPFGPELFARKPVRRLMDEDFLAVEQTHSLQQISRLLTGRARQSIEEDFVITRDGRYLGIGRAIDVLRLITEQRLQQARHANPLTLLPGNVPIQQCLTRLLQNPREALVCYVDIDHFKPFNDCYGYAKGDEVLLDLARCLAEQIDPQCDFLGHIGGDDFLLVLTSPDWRRRLARLQEEFPMRCRRLYRREHLEAGRFGSHDRQGHRHEFPLLSLSLGAVHLFPEACTQLNAAQLAELASGAKRRAKALPGNSLAVIDTRRLAREPEGFT
ncbi:EAL/GGDEF domain-containing protein [Azotobacter vinelandii CA]|uniref:EAL/GGDEF domain-containing protein n=2 Tax=Azotobacter vinelandii TaxID=354 RepID=C1DMG6_AZOVD|nr:bifunctional diguanylate cyclase/phosphodiesterase [Azotobacter vinelandii]ACO81243.1 EAL/GGDEF domain-containing protein [Azotobacter vinelandii DJ]AGK14124.1 EAL/GGDEF domain-containing protein [Azotobacter vinelandii CA]AGK22425.1 EAL/GGDEF domain-containing protein [Azotobacter vinelandii CA6]WKN21982.1 EAL and GGDEF domain-containing protein [Azotobacter vinelandii]SFY09663.1 diguanylate cyclase/phosphodiesterase [Azotobacter vinelandii]